MEMWFASLWYNGLSREILSHLALRFTEVEPRVLLLQDGMDPLQLPCF